MLLTLADSELEPPIFIRKIDGKSKWHPESEQPLTQNERAQKVAEALFKEQDNIYSLWLVHKDSDFYGVIASLSANRTPRDQNIDFIWITEDELKELGIEYKQVTESECIAVQKLHYNAEINRNIAQSLCHYLKIKNREPQRCKAKQTKEILEHQFELGCKAINEKSNQCKCENQSF